MAGSSDSINPDELAELLAGANLEVEAGSNNDERYHLALEIEQGCWFLSIAGRVVQPIPDEFKSRVNEALEHYHPKRVVVDLSGCDFMCSGALGYLMEVFTIATPHDAQVLMVAPNQRVRGMIDLLGLSECFLLVEDRATAIAFYQAQGI